MIESIIYKYFIRLFLMFRKIVFLLALIPLLASADNVIAPRPTKSFYLEALYGFGYMNHPQQVYIHDAEIRPIFLTDNYIQEVVLSGEFSQKVKKDDPDTKYISYDAEYRFGMRLDNQLDNMGMIMGSIYFGLGYQNITQKLPTSNTNSHYLYIPVGFWGEDTLSDTITDFRLRYGILTKIMFANNDNIERKFKFSFLYGGKVYLGIAYNFSNTMEIFVQGYFQYNAPIKNLRQYGLEVGFQF